MFCKTSGTIRARFAVYYRNPIWGFLHTGNLDGDSAPHTLGQRTFFKCAKLASVKNSRSIILSITENPTILLKALFSVIHIFFPIGLYMNTFFTERKFYVKTKKRTRNNLHAPHQSQAYRCSIRNYIRECPARRAITLRIYTPSVNERESHCKI